MALFRDRRRPGEFVTCGTPGSCRAALIGNCAYVDSQRMDDITILQAEVLKTLASPRRLEIIHILARGPIEVGRLAEVIGASQPNVSQHLSVLRAAGIVDAERDGREVRYRLADPDVTVACALMRGVLERRLTRLGEMAAISSAASASTRIEAPAATSPGPAAAIPAASPSR
jgi:ArsR family transcriptional regulator